METIVQVIAQFGFPIAACIALFVSSQKEKERHQEESERMTAAINSQKETFNNALHEQKQAFTEALNNNTLVMQQLLDTLRKAE